MCAARCITMRRKVRGLFEADRLLAEFLIKSNYPLEARRDQAAMAAAIDLVKVGEECLLDKSVLVANAFC